MDQLATKSTMGDEEDQDKRDDWSGRERLGGKGRQALCRRTRPERRAT